MARINTNRSAGATTAVNLTQGEAPLQPNNRVLLIGKILTDTLPIPDTGYSQLEFYKPFRLPSYINPSEMVAYLQNLGLTYISGISFDTTLEAPTVVDDIDGVLVWNTQPANWALFTSDVTGTLTQDTSGATAQFTGVARVGNTYEMYITNITGTFDTSNTIDCAMIKQSPIPDTDKSDPILVNVYHALVTVQDYLANLTGDQTGTNPTIDIVIMPNSSTDYGDTVENIDNTWYKCIGYPYPMTTDADILTNANSEMVGYTFTQNSAEATNSGQYGCISVFGNITSTRSTISTLPNARVNTVNTFGFVSYPYNNAANQGQMTPGICASSVAALIAAGLPPYAGCSGARFPSWFVPADLNTTYQQNVDNPDVLAYGWIPVYINNGIATSDVTTSTLLFVPGTDVPATSNWDLQSTETIISYKQQATQQLKLNINKKGTYSNIGDVYGQVVAVAKNFEDNQMFYNVAINSKSVKVTQATDNATKFLIQMPISIVQNMYQFALNSNVVQPVFEFSFTA